MLEGTRNLVDYFQSQGYFDAEVDFNEESPTPGVQRIDYTSRATPVTAWWASRSPAIVSSILDTDSRASCGARRPACCATATGATPEITRQRPRRDSRPVPLKRIPRRAGGGHTLDDYRGRTDELGVRYEIEEGVQWTVTKLQIEGASPERRALICATIIQSQRGQPFSEANIAADRDAILSYFFNNGYPDATFDWSQTPLGFRITRICTTTSSLGERQFVRAVLVRGLETTRPNVVSSRILIHRATRSRKAASAKLSRSSTTWAFFPKCKRRCRIPTARKKASTCYFSWMKRLNTPSTSESARNWRASAGASTTFDSPAGTTGFSPRVTAGISRLNFLGRARTLSLQTLASTLEQRGVLSYRHAGIRWATRILR